MNQPRELNVTLVNELKALLGERATTARGIREQHGKDESYFPVRGARRGGFSADHGRSARCRQHLPPPPGSDDPLRRGHLARGPYPGGEGRRMPRPEPDEPGARGARSRPRRGGAGGRDAQAAERTHPPYRPVLPDRPRRRCDHRRHGRDARLGHQRGALRHHARERDFAHRGARRRAHHQDRAASEKIRGGLRPDAAVRRLRGHARASSPKSR